MTSLNFLKRQAAAWLGLLLLCGCVNHPIDCGVGIYHADCLPDTAGYLNPNTFAGVDDRQCQSYGLSFGTSEYAQCRERLSTQHRGPEPTLGVIVGVPRANPAPTIPFYPIPTNRSLNCTSSRIGSQTYTNCN